MTVLVSTLSGEVPPPVAPQQPPATSQLTEEMGMETGTDQGDGMMTDGAEASAAVRESGTDRRRQCNLAAHGPVWLHFVELYSPLCSTYLLGYCWGTGRVNSSSFVQLPTHGLLSMPGSSPHPVRLVVSTEKEGVVQGQFFCTC